MSKNEGYPSQEEWDDLRDILDKDTNVILNENELTKLQDTDPAGYEKYKQLLEELRGEFRKVIQKQTDEASTFEAISQKLEGLRSQNPRLANQMAYQLRYSVEARGPVESEVYARFFAGKKK